MSPPPSLNEKKKQTRYTCAVYTFFMLILCRYFYLRSEETIIFVHVNIFNYHVVTTLLT